MASQNTYYATLTSYGLEFIQKNLSEGGKFIAEGWYIALGIGDLTPSLDTKDLANRIYDKDSDGYPGIRIEDDPEIGRGAYIQAPRGLQGNIITEMGLFDGDGNLMMSAKTYIDMTKGFEYGLNKVFDIGISLIALPADVDIVIVNPPSSYPTYEQVSNQLNNYQLLEEKSKPNGYASLNQDGIVPNEQLPPPISLDNCANLDLSNLSETGLNLIKGATTFANEGKCLLPGGLLFQWGQRIGFNWVTFPQRFSVLYGIYTTVITGEACVACPITDCSVSGFYLRNATHGGRHDDRPGLNNFWMAIGKA